MAPYLDAVLASIREGLMSKGRRNAPPEASIFQCISMLATTVGQVLTKHMHEILDLMFAYGLSESLVLALVDLAHHIPPLLVTIQGEYQSRECGVYLTWKTTERLLDLLSIILSGDPFRHPGAPPNSRVTNATTRDMQIQQHNEGRNVTTITLALNTLGTFDFSGKLLPWEIKSFPHNCFNRAYP